MICCSAMLGFVPHHNLRAVVIIKGPIRPMEVCNELNADSSMIFTLCARIKRVGYQHIWVLIEYNA